MVLKPGKEEMAAAIFEKWELDFAVIGEVTDTRHMVLEFGGEVVCDIPLGPLAADAPEYDRPYLSMDDYLDWAGIAPMGKRPDCDDVGADLLKLLASPNLSSRKWISEQYDSQVGADTLQTGGDAGVVRVHGTKKALAISTDCTPRYVHANPYEGGKQAIAEAFRNLCAVGARPLAVTNCLNFANPQRPEIMAQFVHALDGMGTACRVLDFPIVSGNVSLYNESKATGGGSAILPTPAIGGVGVLDDWQKAATLALKPDQELVVIGDTTRPGQVGQSLWLKIIHDAADGLPPRVDLEAEAANAAFVRRMIAEGRVSAVHDVADGGILVALAEMALAGDTGFTLGWDEEDPDFWFGEHQGCYILAVDRFDALAEAGGKEAIQMTPLGKSGGDTLHLFEDAIPLTELRKAHESFFPALMEGKL